MKVVRAVVHGRVETVKTEYSEDELPLDADFAAILLDWKWECEARVRKALDEGITPLAGLDLVFTSPATGRHFHTGPAQQDYTTFVRLAAALWHARSAAPARESGV
jgi:integrase